MDSGHFFLSSDIKNFGQITKHSLRDVTDLKHGVFLPVKTEGCDSRPKHCHCHRHCSINNNILLWSIMSWLKSDSSALAYGRHIQTIFPAEIFQDLYNKVIYNPHYHLFRMGDTVGQR